MVSRRSVLDVSEVAVGEDQSGRSLDSESGRMYKFWKAVCQDQAVVDDHREQQNVGFKSWSESRSATGFVNTPPHNTPSTCFAMWSGRR